MVSTSSMGANARVCPGWPGCPRACVHSVPGVHASSVLVEDHSTAGARSCASPAGGAPANAGRWPPARQRALRGCGYTLGRQGASAPTTQVGKVVWCSWASIIRGWTPASKSHVLRPRERLPRRASLTYCDHLNAYSDSSRCPRRSGSAHPPWPSTSFNRARCTVNLPVPPS